MYKYQDKKTLFSPQPDKESMRVAKSNPAYDVTFTLVSPQPDLLDIRWDIAFGIEGGFSIPFQNKFDSILI